MKIYLTLLSEGQLHMDKQLLETMTCKWCQIILYVLLYWTIFYILGLATM
jgi:hypothetical protein